MTPSRPEAIADLVHQRGAALTLFARQWTQSPEDVVQEALVELFHCSPWPDEPVAWLFRVVRNRALNEQRSFWRRKRRESEAARNQSWFVADEFLLETERSEANAATEALRHLDAPTREIIVARIWGELTYEAIAELTQSSLSTVYRRYHGGLRELRRRIQLAEDTCG